MPPAAPVVNREPFRWFASWLSTDGPAVVTPNCTVAAPATAGNTSCATKASIATTAPALAAVKYFDLMLFRLPPCSLPYGPRIHRGHYLF